MTLEEAKALLDLRNELGDAIEAHVQLYATPGEGESNEFAEELIRGGYINLPEGVKNIDRSIAF